MKRMLAWTVGVLAVGAVGYYIWNAWAPQPSPEAPAAVSAPVPAVSPGSAPPPIQYPLHREPSQNAAPLPALDASDAVFGNALARILGHGSMPALFYPDRMIRRIVATIDNLPRREVPVSMMPVKPVGGAFLAERSATGWIIDARNAARYTRYVDILRAANPAAIVDMYVRLYPLFQQAYRELGYPRGYFNDRLIEALDDLLAAPDMPDPVAVVQPKVLYEFADPGLEARSAGQRIMMRIGHANAMRVRQWLQGVRTELASRVARN